MAIEDRGADELVLLAPGLEQQEMPRVEGGAPPGKGRGPVAGAEAAALARRGQEAVEPGECAVGRVQEAVRGRRLHAGAGLAAREAVVAVDAQSPALGRQELLARLRGDAGEERRIVGTRGDRDGEPVARGDDLLHLAESQPGEERREAGRRWHLGVGHHHVEPRAPGPGGDRREPTGHHGRPGPGGHGATRHVGPAAAQEAPPTTQDEGGRAVVEEQVMGLGAHPLTLEPPGKGLLHIAAGHVHHPPVPGGELLRHSLADHAEGRDPAARARRHGRQPASPASPAAGPAAPSADPRLSPARDRAQRTRARWAVS